MQLLINSFKSKSVWWVGGASAMFVLTLFLFRAWWVSPEHRIAQFATGLVQGNPAIMLSLCDEAETTRLGLTPDKLATVLTDILGSPGGIRLTQSEAETFNADQMRFNRALHATLSDSAGNALKDAGGAAATVYIIAYNTKQGWKIGLSKFLHSIALARLPGANRYSELCQRHQLPLEMLDPGSGEWKPFQGG